MTLATPTNDKQRAAFDVYIASLGEPDDAFNHWHMDEGNLYHLWTAARNSAMPLEQTLESMKQTNEALVKRLAECRDALLIARQFCCEVNFAQINGKAWYTRGASGLFDQIRMHQEKTRKAIDALHLPTTENGKL